MTVVAQKACSRCGHPMSSVAEIAPFVGGPGLVAFICTDCGTTDSVLFHAGGEARRPHGTPVRSSESVSVRADLAWGQPDHRQGRRLRPRREGPRGRRAAEQRDEVPPPHGAYRRPRITDEV